MHTSVKFNQRGNNERKGSFKGKPMNMEENVYITCSICKEKSFKYRCTFIVPGLMGNEEDIMNHPRLIIKCFKCNNKQFV